MINDFHFGQKPGMRGICSLFLLTALLAGCVEPIVMDPEESEMPVVVNCALNIDAQFEPQRLTLQYARGKSQKEYIPVEDANVYIEEYLSEKLESTIHFTHKEDCVWESKPQTLYHGRRFVLHVEIPGREPIVAETISPVELNLFDKAGEYSNILKVKIKPGQERVLERCALWVTATELLKEDDFNGTLLDYLITDHPGADGITLTGKKFSELNFPEDSDNPYVESFRNEFNKARDHYYNYPLYDKFIRIGHLDVNTSFSFYAGPIYLPDDDVYYCAEAPEYFCLLRYYVMTDDLDKYIRSAFLRRKQMETDLTGIYSIPEDIPTNIEGGLGVFGAYFRRADVSFVRRKPTTGQEP